MGPVRFVIFYLLGGIAALALQVAIGPDSAVPTLGASGAIAGVLGRLHRPLSARAGPDADLPHHLLHLHRAARGPVPLHLVRPAGGLRRRRPDQPERQRRRGRVLRPRWRLRLRPAGHQAVRETPQRGLRPAEVPRLLMRGRDPAGGAALGRRPALPHRARGARGRRRRPHRALRARPRPVRIRHRRRPPASSRSMRRAGVLIAVLALAGCGGGGAGTQATHERAHPGGRRRRCRSPTGPRRRPTRATVRWRSRSPGRPTGCTSPSSARRAAACSSTSTPARCCGAASPIACCRSRA